MESPRLASSCKCYNQSELSAVITPVSCAADFLIVGTWLSLVEHSLGVRGVGSSNLPVPTNFDLEPFELAVSQPIRFVPEAISEVASDKRYKGQRGGGPLVVLVGTEVSYDDVSLAIDK
jgi:hypothetical protein